eukprot:Tbor_TRINITY_DN6110_c2_g1::TRINITY_DN6110_c2_g1_i9::g.21892::m.21892
MGCTNSKEQEGKSIPVARRTVVNRESYRNGTTTTTTKPPQKVRQPSLNESKMRDPSLQSPVQHTIANKKERHDNQKSTDIIRNASIDADQNYVPSRYKMGGPKMQGEVKALFKTGLLYRIVRDDEYSYYNDTSNYEMHIVGDETNLVLYPGENSEIINGNYSYQSWNFTAKPLSLEYRKKIFEEANRRIEDEIAAIRNHTYSDDPEEVLRECVRNSIMYVDNDFKPCQNSMSREHDKRTLPLQPWHRPQDYLPKDLHDKIKTFRHIEPNDIDQGQLGDCWLLCAVAAIAERPKRIEKIFQHPKGAYEETNENRVGAFRCT